jgi:hypothetical protein
MRRSDVVDLQAPAAMEEKMRLAPVSGRVAAVLSFTLLFALVSAPETAQAAGKVTIYGVRLEPYGDDAEDYSRPGWGGGVRLVAPVPSTGRLFAGAFGAEIVNLLVETVHFQDAVTKLRVDQETNQNYGRVYLGGELGPHGRGFLRPYVAAHIAWAFYWIETDVVIPDDSVRENEIRQDLDSEWNDVFGYDLTIGMDWNFHRRWSIDSGVRFVKSFDVPQQLGDRSLEIHPEYFEVFLGVGIAIPQLGG